MAFLYDIIKNEMNAPKIKSQKQSYLKSKKYKIYKLILVNKNVNKVYKTFLQRLSSTDKEIGGREKEVEDKFFLSNQKCNTATIKGICNSFVLDDKTFYLKVLRKEKRRQERFADKNLSEEEELLCFLNQVQRYLEEYFGVTGNMQKRMDINFSSGDAHSIKKYKRKNAAMCFERAAMAHNIFKLFNYKCYFVCNANHAYNLLQTRTHLVLFDSYNPILVRKNKRTLKCASIIFIPKYEAASFLYGDKTLKNTGEWVNILFDNPQAIEILPFEYPGLNLQRGKEIVLD